MRTGGVIEPLHSAVIHVSDALTQLRRMLAGSIHCVVTSPPYWRHRNYQVEGQLGQERTPEEFVANLVAIFSEVGRVLQPQGTAWLNVGDTYVKQSLALIPQMLALALKADGWLIRCDVIWHKPNAMPDSGAKHRPGKGHEYVFMLARSRDHFYDFEAVEEPAEWARWGKQTTKKRNPGTLSWVEDKPKEELTSRTTKRKRSVWSIPTGNYTGVHTAVFPEALVEPCILSGSPLGGTVLDPFSGSGTTGIVALRHDRSFVGIELNPEFAVESVKRIESQTGRQVLLIDVPAANVAA